MNLDELKKRVDFIHAKCANPDLIEVVLCTDDEERYLSLESADLEPTDNFGIHLVLST